MTREEAESLVIKRLMKINKHKNRYRCFNRRREYEGEEYA